MHKESHGIIRSECEFQIIFSTCIVRLSLFSFFGFYYPEKGNGPARRDLLWGSGLGAGVKNADNKEREQGNWLKSSGSWGLTHCLGSRRRVDSDPVAGVSEKKMENV